MDLPSGEHQGYVGIDPGFSGAISYINKTATMIEVHDLPVTGEGKKREFDLDGIIGILRRYSFLPDTVVGLEWPSTRPGEGAERSERFGRGKGYLHALCHALKLRYHLVVPALWKGRLSLPGKTDPTANQQGLALLRTFYSEAEGLVLGPRGGIKDGRLDALLIAHFLRTLSVGGMRSVVNKFGKGSVEAQALLLGRGRRKSVMKVTK